MAGSPLVTIAGVDLVAAGTWNLSTGPATFTTGDLAAALDAANCPAVGSPVIKLGHVDPRFDGEPAIGRVTNMQLATDGYKITGDLTGLPGWLGEIITSAYPNRSIEGSYGFVCQIGHTHPFVITGLALLGVAAPGVGVLNSLEDVAGLYEVAAAADPGRTWSTVGGIMPRNGNLKLIVACARDGRLTPNGALRWARRSARGEDVSILRQLARAAEPLPEPDLSRLANDVASILAAGAGGDDPLFPANAAAAEAYRRGARRADPYAEQIGNAEADALFPPSSFGEADRREREVAASRAGDLSLDEVFDSLFGPVQAAAPGHEPLTGTHSHSHASYAGDGSTHVHMHSHNGDANHDHPAYHEPPGGQVGDPQS